MEEKERSPSEIEKDELLVKMQERMKAPLKWPSIDSCKIVDLQPQHFDEVLRLIKRHYFTEDPMCASAGLANDPISIQCFVEYIRVWMKDTTSLIAISAKSERIVGVIIARPNSKVDRSITYSRMQIAEGEVLQNIINFKNTLVKRADVHNYYKQPDVFRLYIFCVHPSYKSKGLETALLEAFLRMAIALEIPVAVGLFTAGVNQEFAKNLGFEVLAEVRYSKWIVDDKVIFPNPGIGNYSAAIMGMLTPSLDHLDQIRRERKAAKREDERRRRKHRH